MAVNKGERSKPRTMMSWGSAVLRPADSRSLPPLTNTTTCHLEAGVTAAPTQRSPRWYFIGLYLGNSLLVLSSRRNSLLIRELKLACLTRQGEEGCAESLKNSALRPNSSVHPLIHPFNKIHSRCPYKPILCTTARAALLSYTAVMALSPA